MEFFDPIIDFLGQRGGLLQKYYWQIVLGIVASALAAIAVRERAKKWRDLKDDYREAMLDKPLRATVYSTEDEKEVRYTASISPCASGFRIKIEREAQLVQDETAPSLDEMEAFLRENTRFILADFQ